MRYACSTQLTYSAGVTSPIMSVRLRMRVLRFRQLSIAVPLRCPERRKIRWPGARPKPPQVAYLIGAACELSRVEGADEVGNVIPACGGRRNRCISRRVDRRVAGGGTARHRKMS